MSAKIRQPSPDVYDRTLSILEIVSKMLLCLRNPDTPFIIISIASSET